MAAGAGRRHPEAIRLLQLTSFVSTIDRFAMPPMLVAIAVDLDVPLSAVVQAAGAYFLAYGLMQPVWGTLSDVLGRVRTMQLTLLLAGACSILSAFATTAVTLGVARALAGALFGAAYPASLIYLGDTVPAERRQRAITRLMVGVAIGTAVASMGAGLLAQAFTWRAAFVTTGAAGILLAIALRALPEPVLDRAGRSLFAPLAEVLHSRAAGFVLLLAFAEGAVLLGVLTLLPPAVESTGASAGLAGTVTGAYGISVYLFSALVGHLSRRTHPARLIALGAFAALLASSVLAVSQVPVAALVVAGLLGLAWTAMHSSLQTWATEVLPAARAPVVSLFAGSLFVGSALSAVLFAGLVDAGRYSLVFTICAVLVVPLGVAATWGRARWQRPTREST